MALHLRQAQLADRDAVVFFHRSLYLEHRASVMPDGMEDLYAYRDFELVLREDVDAMLRNPSASILLAIDTEPVGYVTGYVVNEPRRMLSRKGVVGDWFVVPEARGLGVGRKLLEALLAIFAGAGCSVVESSTWPFNTGARRAFEAAGFLETQITFRRQV